MVDPDFEKGSKLLDALDTHKLRPKAAFWLSEDSVWRLILEIPALEKESVSKGYRRIQQVIKNSPDSYPELSNITLVPGTFPLLATLRRVISITKNGNTQLRLTRNNFNGIFIEDALVYRL